MSKYSKLSKVAKSGAVDSKYFNNFEQFDKDVQAKIIKTKEFKTKIRELILEDPNLIEQRVQNVVNVLLEDKLQYQVQH